jgi:hypothetical protein
MLRKLSLFSSCLLFSATLCAQSLPSAERNSVSVWAGAEISTFNPDYGCVNASPFKCWDSQLLGIAPFVDADHLFFKRLGAEGEARFLPWRGPGSGFSQSSYLAGPRFGVWNHRERLFFFAKVLMGLGTLDVPSPAIGGGNYFVYAPGITMDFRVKKRLTARVDYEYQIWPTFLDSGLSPNGFSFGFSYALLR